MCVGVFCKLYVPVNNRTSSSPAHRGMTDFRFDCEPVVRMDAVEVFLEILYFLLAMGPDNKDINIPAPARRFRWICRTYSAANESKNSVKYVNYERRFHFHSCFGEKICSPSIKSHYLCFAGHHFSVTLL